MNYTIENLKKQFDKVVIKHYKNTHKYNGKTVAVLWKGTERYVGISECGKDDQFSRKKGRMIALSRAVFASREDIEVTRHNKYNKQFYNFDIDSGVAVDLDERLFLPKKETL